MITGRPYVVTQKWKDRTTPHVNFFHQAEKVVEAARRKPQGQRRWWRIDNFESCIWRVLCERVVCDKVVCVTKLCVKDCVVTQLCVKYCVWQSCVWKIVYDKVVCERLCVTKLCVCDKVVYERIVCDKVVDDKVVCERLCVTKLCVCDKVACVWQSRIWERWTHLQRGCHEVLHLPRKTKVDVTKCWPAMQSDGGCRQVPCHACQGNEGRCRQLPRLPGKTTVDVAKCYACHAKCRGVTGDQRGPSAPPDPAQCQKCRTCHAKHGSFVLKDGVWKSCVWKRVSDKVVCVKVCVEKWGVCDKVVRDKVVWRRRRLRRDTESKTRTPHKDVGKYMQAAF